MSKRTNILGRIQTILTAITALKHIEIDRISAIDIMTVPLPAAFIYPGNDNISEGEGKDHAVIGLETWDWEVFIEVWAKNTDMEALLATIHTAMHNDYRIGSYAEYSLRTGSEMYVIDSTKAIKGLLLKYRIVYRHPLGSP